MLDTRAESIIYQAQGYLVELVNTLIINKKLGKALNKDWDKADLVVAYLEAWTHKDKLDDVTDMNYILECLILLCTLYQYPAAPTIFAINPPVIINIPGETGPPGPQGNNGATGLATDINITLSVSGVVDSFAITNAKGARWDYIVIQNSGEQRAGSVIASWTEDGLGIELSDISTADINGSTDGISFDVQFDGTNIQLVALLTSGTWNIVATRYFIPNNGNGSGPISGALPNGQVYIGNTSNLAQARTVTGVISITNTGVTSLNSGVISNTHIAAGAAIAVNKLAALSANKLAITDGSGFLTTLTNPSLTEIGYLIGLTSPAQTQITARLIDPTTTIGDTIYRNGSNIIARLPIGTTNQVLTVSGGVPLWVDAQEAPDVAWISSGITYNTNWSGVSPGIEFNYRKIRNVVYLRGYVIKSGTNPTGGMTMLTLPSGYRPPTGRLVRLLVGPQSVSGGVNFIDINTAGQINIGEMGKLVGDPLTNTAVFLDGVSFSTV